MLLIAGVLLLGGWMFQRLGPDRDLSLTTGVYYTWSLLFAQPPIPFPPSPWLRGLFFVVPVLGLSVIIDTIVEFARLVRDRRSFEQSWCRIMAESLRDHIIVVGLGKLGLRSFQILRRLGHRVLIIEKNESKSFVDDVRRDGSAILFGDARRETLLEEAGIARARAIIVATSDDLTNLEIALDARRLAPGVRVVLRMFDQALADKVAGASNIHVAMSQSWISAPAFATAAVEPGVVSSVILDNRLIVMQRWTLRPGGALDLLSVGEAASRHGLAVVEHRPKDAPPTLFPRHDSTLTAGDSVLVQGLYETLADLRPRAAVEELEHVAAKGR